MHCPTPQSLQSLQTPTLLPQRTITTACTAVSSCMPNRTWRSCRTTNGFLMAYPSTTASAQMCSLTRRPIVQNISVYDTLV